MSADSGTTGETQKLQQCSLLAAQYGVPSTTLSKKGGKGTKRKGKGKGSKTNLLCGGHPCVQCACCGIFGEASAQHDNPFDVTSRIVGRRVMVQLVGIWVSRLSMKGIAQQHHDTGLTGVTELS